MQQSPTGASPKRKAVVGYFVAGQYPAGFVDGDKDIQIRSFREAGLDVIEIPWNAPDVGSFIQPKPGDDHPPIDVAYWGSPWDDWLDMEAFLRLGSVLDKLHIPQINARSVVRLTHDKSYLTRLARENVEVMPTKIMRAFHRGKVRDVQELYTVNGSLHEVIVVKPSISGGGLGTGAFSIDHAADALRLIEEIHRCGKDVVVQPLDERIFHERETAIVVVDGVPTHGWSKKSNIVVNADPNAPKKFHPDRRPHVLTEADVAWGKQMWDATKKMSGMRTGERAAIRFDRLGDPEFAVDGKLRNVTLLEIEGIAPVKGYAIDGMDPRALKAFTDSMAQVATASRDLQLAGERPSMKRGVHFGGGLSF